MAYKVTQYNLQYNQGKDSARVEAFYGPWDSVEEFKLSAPGKQAISCGDVITIGVWDEDENTVEYWNPAGDDNFIEKSAKVEIPEGLTEEQVKEIVKNYLNNGEDNVLVCDATELQAAMDSDDTRVIKMVKDITVNATIKVRKEKTLNLNGHILANANTEILYTEEGKSITSGVDALTVYAGGKLTIEGEGRVTVVSGGGSALYATAGEIVVNNGTYESLNGIDAGSGYSLVYADNGGHVTVNGGYYIVNNYDSEAEKAFKYVLNVKDGAIGNGARIDVNGGHYYTWNPFKHDAITKRPEYPELYFPVDEENNRTVDSVMSTETIFNKFGHWYHIVNKVDEKKA